MDNLLKNDNNYNIEKIIKDFEKSTNDSNEELSKSNDII